MDFESIDASPGTEPFLAKWSCDADLWGQFKDAERIDSGVRSARNLTISSAVVLLIVLIVIPLMLFQGYLTSVVKIQIPIITVAVTLPLIFTLSGLILWLVQRSKAAAMDTEHCEVIVRLDGFKINGLGYYWRFGGKHIQFGGTVWRFQNCQRKTVAGRLGSRFEVLEFYCEGTALKMRYGSGGPTSVFWRVPVPQDRITDADRVVERLNLEFLSVK